MADSHYYTKLEGGGTDRIYVAACGIKTHDASVFATVPGLVTCEACLRSDAFRIRAKHRPGDPVNTHLLAGFIWHPDRGIVYHGACGPVRSTIALTMDVDKVDCQLCMDSEQIDRCRGNLPKYSFEVLIRSAHPVAGANT